MRPRRPKAKTVLSAASFLYIYIYITNCRQYYIYITNFFFQRLLRFWVHMEFCVDTELSKHIWQVKGNEQCFTIKWKILAKVKPFSNLTKRCNLCTTEKHFLITKPELTTLNKQNELISTCRHRRTHVNRSCNFRSAFEYKMIVTVFPMFCNGLL